MLYERFYPSKSESNQNSQKFVDLLFHNINERESNTANRITAAQLQGYFMQYKFDENEAIRNVDEIIKPV